MRVTMRHPDASQIGTRSGLTIPVTLHQRSPWTAQCVTVRSITVCIASFVSCRRWSGDCVRLARSGRSNTLSYRSARDICIPNRCGLFALLEAK